MTSPTLTVMINAARKAARGLQRDFGEVENLQVSLKGPANFVTKADQRTEGILQAELTKARPNYGLLMEEGGAIAGRDGEHRWLVDPIDGTTNFIHGIPHFAMSIALERSGMIIAGVIYNPISNDLFTAERGRGAFLNDRRLRVAARRELRDAVIACGIPHLGRGDTGRFGKELGRLAAESGRRAPLRGRGARSRLGCGRAPRRLLGAQAGALGHRGGPPDGARGRRARRGHRRRRSAGHRRRAGRQRRHFPGPASRDHGGLRLLYRAIWGKALFDTGAGNAKLFRRADAH
jgi:myo-inositol-1(or 4)-monophosphatase